MCSVVAISEKTPKICIADVIPLPNKLIQKKKTKSQEYLMMTDILSCWSVKLVWKCCQKSLGTKFNNPFHMLYTLWVS